MKRSGKGDLLRNEKCKYQNQIAEKVRDEGYSASCLGFLILSAFHIGRGNGSPLQGLTHRIAPIDTLCSHSSLLASLYGRGNRRVRNVLAPTKIPLLAVSYIAPSTFYHLPFIFLSMFICIICVIRVLWFGFK